ncbi:MAG: hypothetical protein ABIP21_01390, partial [Acidimicrobiia bacterium]
ETAKTAGVRGLKTECDRVAAAAASRDGEREQYERIRAARSLRHRRLAGGTGSIEIRGPLDRTAQMMAALEPFERDLFTENRTNGRRVHPDAVAFDALVRLCEQAVCESTRPERKTGSRPLAMVIVHMSKTAYERGWTEPGEVCEIEGVGPIPVAVARRMASDAILKSLVMDGVDVTRISHYGRTIPSLSAPPSRPETPYAPSWGVRPAATSKSITTFPSLPEGSPNSPTSAGPATTTTTRRPDTTSAATDHPDNNNSSPKPNTHDSPPKNGGPPTTRAA